MKVKDIECYGDVFKEVEVTVSIPDKDFGEWTRQLREGEKTKSQIAALMGEQLANAMADFHNERKQELSTDTE